MTGLRRHLGALAAALAVGLTASAAFAAPDCEALAEAAAGRHGIPEGVMAAIARTESGGGPRRSAWPWTLNMGGDGRYLETRDEALTLLRATLEGGRRNVDVGCMQINWHWHNEEFDSLAQMIDPAVNTEYAARFLVSLWRREGTWDAAVAAYHSSEPDRGAAYLARVEDLRRSGVGRTGPGEAAAMPGVLSEGVLVAAATAPTEPAGTFGGGGGDQRFGAQAPLVGFPTRDGAAAPRPASVTPVAPDLPEGALPDLEAGLARFAMSEATSGQGRRGLAPSDRLARLQDEFRQMDAP